MSRTDDTLPFVCTVIPTRDRPAFVRRAVATALAQTGVDVEVVIVDITDPQVRIVRNRESQGVAAARP